MNRTSFTLFSSINYYKKVGRFAPVRFGPGRLGIGPS